MPILELGRRHIRPRIPLINLRERIAAHKNISRDLVLVSISKEKLQPILIPVSYLPKALLPFLKTPVPMELNHPPMPNRRLMMGSNPMDLEA